MVSDQPFNKQNPKPVYKTDKEIATLLYSNASCYIKRKRPPIAALMVVI